VKNLTPKYRAWIKDLKSMGEVTYIDYSYEGSNIGEIIEIGVTRKTAALHEDPYGTYDPDSVVLMAFTGMYDTLGEELYEYDIVMTSTKCAPYFQKSIIFWDDEKASFRTLHLDPPYNYDTQKMYTLESPVCIGNIFQTPQFARNLLPVENSPYASLSKGTEDTVRVWVDYVKGWTNKIGIFKLYPNGSESTEQAGCNRSSSTDIGIDVERSASSNGEIHMEENSASSDRGLDPERKDSSISTAKETAPVPTEERVGEAAAFAVDNIIPYILKQAALSPQSRIILTFLIKKSIAKISPIVYFSQTALAKETGTTGRTVFSIIHELKENKWLEYFPNMSKNIDSKFSCEPVFERFIRDTGLSIDVYDVFDYLSERTKD